MVEINNTEYFSFSYLFFVWTCIQYSLLFLVQTNIFCKNSRKIFNIEF